MNWGRGFPTSFHKVEKQIDMTILGKVMKMDSSSLQILMSIQPSWFSWAQEINKK
jgi:hypothetical protein